ncbi:hypothetical protein BDV24DRAFT_167582 [Aspergillus arachidicola]|uniref:Uncharacterized protein n=1 Tax=Aspergillus arachidicola TaxID=656916 RepID=A0A5N6XVK0_9EURO|nr:hypothetical protein BDV24DRAFT_167582 [Aspergillus arachidicola]
MSYAERNQFGDNLNACIAHLRKIPNNTPNDSEIRLPAHISIIASLMDLRRRISYHISVSQYSSRLSVIFYALRLASFESACGPWAVEWNCRLGMYRLCAVPQYWEFTKAMYGARGREVFEQIFYSAFGPQLSGRTVLHSVPDTANLPS